MMPASSLLQVRQLSIDAPGGRPLFREFFIIGESGCRHFSGSFDALLSQLDRESDAQQQRYARNLGRLLDREEANARLGRRRQRKKNLGRLHELGRCPSRARLNENRSYAQESQGKRAALQRDRIGAARDWARATRRALSVDLPLELALPTLPEQQGPPVARLDAVAASARDRVLFQEVSLRIGRGRVAITGPNGSGKTTLIQILVGQRRPTRGRASCDADRIGYVAQNASNWLLEESLLDRLTTYTDATSPGEVVRILRAHRFPFALAQRSLVSLSPGERLRAALICLCQRRTPPELLVLDEPTDHLDFLGASALQSILCSWTGGLLVASHDREFLDAIGMHERLELGGAILVSDRWLPVG